MSLWSARGRGRRETVHPLPYQWCDGPLMRKEGWKTIAHRIKRIYGFRHRSFLQPRQMPGVGNRGGSERKTTRVTTYLVIFPNLYR